MTRHAEHVPVIVGIGEFTQKGNAPAEGLEPLALAERSVRLALQDAGTDLLPLVDSLRVVSQVTWAYEDLAGLLAERLGLHGVRAMNGPVGGESPVRLLVDAAAEIASGRARATLLCGAEALRTLGQSMADGAAPAHWTPPHAGTSTPQAEDFVTEQAAHYGLLLPLDVYPLYENALRAAWGQSFEEAQAESGLIWSNMALVAKNNPHAWSGRAMAPLEVVTPGPDNRPVSFPYQKFMVANLSVNQASAVLLTSLAAARAAGIPEERLVYVWGGAGANEPKDVLARDRFDHAPAMAAVLRGTLARHGLSAAEVELHEIYSCFPCVPKMARRTLGLPADAPMTVAGGLTFFGGPGNNYMTHAATAMVRALRAGQGRHGLLYGNGEFVTKHHAAIVSRLPPPQGVSIANDDLQAQVQAAYGAVPVVDEDYEGPCIVESFLLRHDATGRPDRGTVVGRTPDGRRVLARVTEDETQVLAWLATGDADPVGKPGQVFRRGDGWTHFAFERPAQVEPPAVRFEKVTPHIALVTIDRPQQRNAVNGAVARLLAQYVDRVEQDPEIRVAILTGSEGSFSAGADLTESRAGRGQDMVVGRKGFAGFVTAKRSKPWIAAVNGFALGGGTELALACDLAIAGENARFGLPEVARSLIAGAGGLVRLPRVLPQRVALELILTGRSIDARRAHALHLVNCVVADAAVVDEALKLANEIAANAPRAVSESLQIARRSVDEPEAVLHRAGIEAIRRLVATRDFIEGLSAFAEKRPPEWTGH